MFNRTATVRSGAAVAQRSIIDVRTGGSSLYDAPDPYEAGRRAREAVRSKGDNPREDESNLDEQNES